MERRCIVREVACSLRGGEGGLGEALLRGCAAAPPCASCARRRPTPHLAQPTEGAGIAGKEWEAGKVAAEEGRAGAGQLSAALGIALGRPNPGA